MINTEIFYSLTKMSQKNDRYLESIYMKALQQWRNSMRRNAHHLVRTKALEWLLQSKLFDIIVTKHRISNNNHSTLAKDIENHIEDLLNKHGPKGKINNQNMIEKMLVTKIFCPLKEIFQTNDKYLDSIDIKALQQWRDGMTQTLESLLNSKLFDIIVTKHRISNNNHDTLAKEIENDIENLLNKYGDMDGATGDFLTRLFNDEQRNWQKNADFSTRDSALASLKKCDLYHVFILRRAFTMKKDLTLEEEIESFLNKDVKLLKNPERIKVM